eukprot:COSAG04_NODE_2151_length_4684_cov_2.043402_5_plen_44_part_01
MVLLYTLHCCSSSRERFKYGTISVTTMHVLSSVGYGLFMTILDK